MKKKEGIIAKVLRIFNYNKYNNNDDNDDRDDLKRVPYTAPAKTI